MTEKYNAFKASLLSLKETISKLIAYPGNQVYKTHLEERVLLADKNFKLLKSFLEKSSDTKVIELLIKMAALMQTVQIAPPKERITAIKGMEIYCNDLEVYLEEGLSDSQDLFSPALQALLGKAFEVEYCDLRLVYNKSGTCTAFLLRKMLEKAAFIALSKAGKHAELVDLQGRSKGMDALLDMASKEKVGHYSILSPKTYKMIQGAKYLGDSAAHNPIAVVDMHEIIPQLPFVTMALKEMGRAINEAK